MTSKKIKDRAKKFIDSLKSLEGLAIESACRKELQKLKEVYSITYVRSAMTEYRKELDSQSFTTYSVQGSKRNVSYLLRIDKKEQKKIKKDDKKRIKRLNKNLVHISCPDTLVEIAKGLISSGNVPKIAVGLCMLTGRRSSEIMKTAEFKQLGKSEKKVIFSGQLKKRIKSNKKSSYTIYTLGNTATLCMQGLEYIRANANATELDLDETKKRYNPQINRACKRAYMELLGRGISAHELRRIYGIIAASKHKRKNQSMPDFLADLLGHESGDLATATRYQKHYL